MRAVPPYFDYLIEGFRRGEVDRHVHLGHWDTPPPAVRSGDFRRAQARLADILVAMAELSDGQRLLDVGCGFGGTLDIVNRHHRSMTLAGVNIDSRQLDICRQIAPANGNRLHWELADACALPFEAASFDRVTCIEAMFHFASRRRFFAEAARVLEPGGALIATDIVFSPAARALDTADFPIEQPVAEGYGPWRDFWSEDADHRALGIAAGLQCRILHDATAQTLPSHMFTAPHSPYDKLDAAGRAASRLHWLHRNGHLKYLYMRFDKPA